MAARYIMAYRLYGLQKGRAFALFYVELELIKLACYPFNQLGVVIA
jgi:hypothetical protein